MKQNFRSQILSNIVVARTDRGTVEISWETEASNLSLSVYVGESTETIERKSPIARVTGRTRIELVGLDPRLRYYFELLPDGGRGIVVAERRIPLDGAVNFRDLGGYEAADGRRVKWGRIFRSDHLSWLSDVDQNLIRRLGIKLVCDFRTPAEVSRAPDLLPEDDSVDYLHLPIVNSQLDPANAFEMIKKGDLSWLTMEFMMDNYIECIDRFGDVWGQVFRRLADAESRPMVFHCTGGKDRAGICAALILLALGVPEQTVVYDHGLSDVFNADRLKEIHKRIESFGIAPGKLAPYLTAPRELIVSLLEHLRETYGSAVDYLKTKAHTNDQILARLKEDLLE